MAIKRVLIARAHRDPVGYVDLLGWFTGFIPRHGDPLPAARALHQEGEKQRSGHGPGSYRGIAAGHRGTIRLGPLALLWRLPPPPADPNT